MLQPGIFVPAIYILAAIYYALLGLYAWGKRPAVAVVSFAWVMLAISIWSFTYGLEIFFPTLEAKLLMVDIEFIGITGVSIFLFIFALNYTGRSHLLTPGIRVWAGGIALFFLLMVWTNPLHHFMWSRERVIEENGLLLFDQELHLGFWIQASFSYLMILIASIMLIMDFLKNPGVFRIRISFVILGVLFSLMGSFVFVLGIGPIKNLDLAPLFFLPNAIGLFWVTVRYRLLEILPLEHITVLQNMKDGVIVLNNQQRILYINPVSEKLLNKREDEVIGQPFAQVSGAYSQALHPHFAGGEHKAEIEVAEGESSKIFEISVSPISSQNRELSNIMISLHDITQRKEMEKVLSRREAIMYAINLAAEEFLREPTWEQNIPEVLENLGRAADVSRVHVVVNHTTDEEVVLSSLRYEWAADGIAPQINNPGLKNISMERDGFARWVEAMQEGTQICGLIQDFPQQEQEFFKQLGSLSIVAIPIFVEKQWWGFIMFDECREKRYWTEMELDAFHAAANIFGAAEARSRAEQQVIHRQNALSLLNEIVRISLQAENMNDMAQIVVGRLGELIAADGCYLTLWDSANERAVPLAAYGEQRDKYLSLKFEPGETTFTQSSLELGHRLVVEDTEASPYAAQRVIRQIPVKSLIALPLIAIKKKLGAVLLAFDKAHHFTPDEIAISEQAAALIALALEKFQAMEEAKLRAITSENLRKASAAITETLDSDKAIKQILEQLKLVIPYDSASVQLLEGNELKIVGGNGFAMIKEVLEMRFPIPGNNPNTIVIQTGKPYIMGDAPSKYKAFREKQNAHIHSWLGVPLNLQGKVIGLLAIDSSEKDDFTEEDAAIASTFADQVAVVIENTRIFEETQQQAILDPLTRIFNRRGLFQVGMEAFNKSEKSDGKFCAIMADVDRFKDVNDSYGHDAGDKVLQTVAARCKKGIRDFDLIGRYGGEELVILLPDTNIRSGMAVAERLRKSIESAPVQISNEFEIYVTVSMGVACADQNTTSLETLINRADQAMYIAKHHGRNKVECSV